MGKKAFSRAGGRLLFSLLAIGCQFATTEAISSVGQRSSSPPIILISVDTLRADRLSCYGFRGQPTPNIDLIARGGTLFSQVGSQVPLTLPSHVSLLTSTYPFSNGIEDNGEVLAPHAVTLATLLKSRGYGTAAFVGGFVLDRRFGLDQGFDFYDSPFDLRQPTGMEPDNLKRRAGDVVRAASQWLEENSSHPFFVFLHLYDLHTPYDLSPALQARYGGRGYEAELAYVDDMLGRFWVFLARKGLLKKALVVFTSDHGEGLGEHDENTHGYFIYQSTLWVPLIVHWPEGVGDLTKREDRPLSLIDVAPTILQFAGAPQPREFQGRSLLSLLDQKSPATDEEVYSESLYAHYHFGCSALWSLRLGRYKYIEAPKPEFYDLSQSPGEAHNLYASKNALALSYRERLFSLRARFQSQSRAGPKMLSPEVVARLSSLGYAALSTSHSAPPEVGPDPKDRIGDYSSYRHAVVLALAGRFDQSDRLLEGILARDPKLADVRNLLGENEQKQGRDAEAIEHFRKIVDADPLNALAHYNLGASYYKLGRPDDAIREFEAILSIVAHAESALPQISAPAEELLGTIFLEKKEYGRAQEHFNNVLRMSPRSFVALYNLGWLAAQAGKPEQGIRYLRAALDAQPLNAEAHNALGGLYLEQGDLDKAKDELREAIRLQPKYTWAHYNLGVVFSRENDNDDARREFQEALAEDPQFSLAREALRRMEKDREPGNRK